MKSKILSIFTLFIVLITGELQAQVIFDNRDVSGTVTSFGGGNGFPASRSVLGEDFDTIAPPAGRTWLVDSIDFSMRVFGSEDALDGEITSYENVQVEISLLDLGDTTVLNDLENGNGNYDAGDFADATVLGSETFTLGANGLIAAIGSNANVFQLSVNFTDPIDIGDGVGTGILFRTSDTSGASQLGLISIGYRDSGDPGPFVGVTSDRNYRDASGDGNISNRFGFGSDIGLAFTVHATATQDILLGDTNLDGAVDFQDISPFITILSGSGFLDQADIDQNGVVNFLDISPFISVLSSQ